MKKQNMEVNYQNQPTLLSRGKSINITEQALAIGKIPVEEVAEYV
jgi:hypothetical protein